MVLYLLFIHTIKNLQDPFSLSKTCLFLTLSGIEG